MKTVHPTREFLQRHRRRARGTLLLWSVAATLTMLAFAGLTKLEWWSNHDGWTLTAGGIAAALLGTWFVRVRGLTPQRLARGIDARWTLRGRLETVVELAGEETPWAVAQRDDARLALAERKTPGAFAWRGAQVVLAGVACLLFIEGAAWALRWLRIPPSVAGTSLAATAEANATADDVRALLDWITPDAEIKATAIEEVPLTALAESNTAFRSISLEMLVNGDREFSRPLDPAILGDALKPGRRQLESSLFLDELQVKPFDIVTYRLVAELDTPGAQRVVTSPPQFVQIRPPQRDAVLTGSASEFATLLFELKGGQLRLIKQNAALARLAPTAESDPTWAAENVRVAGEQRDLAGRTAEILTWAESESPEPLVLGNLRDAGREMERASSAIAAADNQSAVRPQNRALALLTELEQFIREVLTGGSVATNPVSDEQAFRLPPRRETPAGELEALAARQKTNNAVLAGASDGPPAAGRDAATEQAAIAQAANALASSDRYETETSAAVNQAEEAATEAAGQLAIDDRAAARVPAAAAQRALEQAVEAQERIGRAAAVAELEQVRRSLNAASRASAEERTKRLAAARTSLRVTAMEQQRSGSAEAAQEVARVAELIDAVASAPDPSAQVYSVAMAAAHAQVLLSARPAAVDRAVRWLKRAGESLPTPDGRSGVDTALADLEIASQEARWITSDATMIEQARQLAARADAAQRSRSAGAAPGAELGAAALHLARALEQGRADQASDPFVRSFSPADVDPLYREAVEKYYERLSSSDGRTASEN